MNDVAFNARDPNAGGSPFAAVSLMPRHKRQRPAVAGIVAAIIAMGMAAPLWACAVPIFRYALDRWPADNYQLHTSGIQTLSPAVAAKIQSMQSDPTANIVPLIDPTVSGDEAQLNFPGAQELAAWSGRLDAKSLNTLLRSPIRREIARRLCTGDSAVWVLLEGSNSADNDRFAALIDNASRESAKVEVLPVRDPADPRSVVGPGPELKVKFSTLRLARNAPGEAATVTMLEGSAKDAEAHRNQPVACLVFGRGHVLAALSGQDLCEASIRDYCDFTVSACSCEVKAQHPGWDLLIDLDWDAELQKVDDDRRKQSPVPTTAGIATSEIPSPTSLMPQTILIQGAQPISAASPIHIPIWPKVLAIIGIGGVLVGLKWVGRLRRKNSNRDHS